MSQCTCYWRQSLWDTKAILTHYGQHPIQHMLLIWVVGHKYVEVENDVDLTIHAIPIKTGYSDKINKLVATNDNYSDDKTVIHLNWTQRLCISVMNEDLNKPWYTNAPKTKKQCTHVHSGSPTCY